MIKRIRFGKPFNTGAIFDESEVEEIAKLNEVTEGKAEKVDIEFATNLGMTLSANGKDIVFDLEKEDVLYGLGQSMHGINKRGFTYVSYNTDEPHHNEDKYSLYGSHNFLLWDRAGEKSGKVGLFVDYPSRVTFDLGDSEKDKVKIHMDEPVYSDEKIKELSKLGEVVVNYDLYFIIADSSLEVIKEFRKLIGPSYKAPEWSFGFGQSRWGYKSEDDIRRVVKGYKEADMPLSMVYVDIDYMDDYKVFTFNKDNYPDIKAFVEEMKEEGIHLLPNLDPGVKMEKGFDIYEEGLENGYFCNGEDGKPYPIAVWPGLSALPDFMKQETRDWFGDKYKFFTEAGIDGFWYDMNEPASFYSPKTLKNALDKIDSVKEKADRLKLFELWDMIGAVDGMAHNDEDYKSFYHETEEGRIRHDRIHNLYGFNMLRTGAKALEEQLPKGESLNFSRSSYIGSHRYGGIWTGDNCSFYSHIELLLHQLPGLNMCGFLYVGADTGGFGFDTNEDLAMRFLELSIFTPLCRNHSALGTREQEFFRFKDKESFSKLLKLRYKLIPYLYKSYNEAIEENTLMFTPLGVAYPDDENARHIEDQLLVGKKIMIAPVYQANVDGRGVYLPEAMTLYRVRGEEDFDKEELNKGYHYVKAAVNEVLIFVLK